VKFYVCALVAMLIKCCHVIFEGQNETGIPAQNKLSVDISLIISKLMNISKI